MNGVLVVDKPEGWTSFDVVGKLRRLSGEKRIGHTGTLDPMATGVLPLLLGRATKAASLLPDTHKMYLGHFRLGEEWDTGDITGKQTAVSPVRPDLRALTEAAGALVGEIMQLPPMYSAVSVHGQRLYSLARQGKEVERERRPVTIHRLEILDYNEREGTGSLLVSCSQGTYIRTLIEDLAKGAGTLGVMTALRRTFACGFTQENAYSIQELIDLAEKSPQGEENPLTGLLRPTEQLFAGYPVVRLSEAQGKRFQNGGFLDEHRLRGQLLPGGTPVRVHDAQGLFLGLGKRSDQGDQSVLKLLKLFECAS